MGFQGNAMFEAIQASVVADPRYPIGKFTPPEPITAADRQTAIRAITDLPKNLRAAVSGLNAEQLNTPYREGGWTVLQLVHHIGDSHMTALHRAKRSLTEDWPQVHGYDEQAFATLADVAAPAEWSLDLLAGVHAHWVVLLHSMTEAQWERGFRHTEHGPMRLDTATLLYAWHSMHHTAHITRLREQRGW